MNALAMAGLAVGAIVVLVVTMAVGYRCVRRVLAGGVQGVGDLHLAGVLPLASGLVTGLVLVAAASPWLAATDRFHTPAGAVLALAGVTGGLVLLLATPAWVSLVRRFGRGTAAAPPSRMLCWTVEWTVVALAAILVMATGTRFGVLGVRGEGDVALGAWSGPLTVLWLVAATGVARLLDGLEGAVNVLLLVAGVAVAYGTLGAGEPVLNAVALVVVFASLGSLRFNFFPAPLPLRGTGSAVAGFMFAVLTVMARQKTVAALLLIFPLAVVVVLVGGVMLGVMERTLLPEGRGGALPPGKGSKTNPPRDNP